ncbi:MAG TPA: cell division protein ZapA [Gammaproteobacteria bacterium]|nr:cell division protein ZapA [Gammaproteobacteria bacterium]
MSGPVTTVTVRILDKEYPVACPEEERAALLQSADLVDRRLREIRQTGKIVGLERMAVMVALNLAHELLQAQSGEAALAEALGTRLRLLTEKLDGALADERQLHL